MYLFIYLFHVYVGFHALAAYDWVANNYSLLKPTDLSDNSSSDPESAILESVGITTLESCARGHRYFSAYKIPFCRYCYQYFYCCSDLSLSQTCLIPLLEAAPILNVLEERRINSGIESTGIHHKPFKTYILL